MGEIDGNHFFTCPECHTGFTLGGSLHLRTVNICTACSAKPDPMDEAVKKITRELLDALTLMVNAPDGRKLIESLPEDQKQRVHDTLKRFRLAP